MKENQNRTKRLKPYTIAAFFVGVLTVFGILVWVLASPAESIALSEKVLIIVFVLTMTSKASQHWIGQFTGLREEAQERLFLAVIGGIVAAVVTVEDRLSESGAVQTFAFVFLVVSGAIFLLDSLWLRFKAWWRARKPPPSAR